MYDFKVGDEVHISSTSIGWQGGKMGIIVGVCSEAREYFSVDIFPGQGVDGMGHDCNGLAKNGWNVHGEDLILKKSNTFIMSNLVEKFLSLGVKEPQKSFRKAGVTNDKDELTSEGRDLFLQFLFEKHQDAFKTEVVDKLLAAEEETKK